MEPFKVKTLSYKKIFWGIILITIGIMIMLKNLNLIWFSWHSLWALWPVLIILWGISVLPVKDYIKLIISFVAVAIGIIVVYTQPEVNTFGLGWLSNHQNWESTYNNDSTFRSDETFTQPFEKSIKEGTLYLDAAAGQFSIGDTTENLYYFQKSGSKTHYQISVAAGKDSTTTIIRLKLKDSTIEGGNGGGSHIKLNLNPVWDINFNVGAAEMQMDLSKYKVRSVKLEGGASSIYLKMGDLNEDQRIKISAGASSIHILVPKNRACEVRSNTVLSFREFSGFNKIKPHLYRSNNYNTAKVKSYIDVDAAVSSLNVEQY